MKDYQDHFDFVKLVLPKFTLIIINNVESDV